MNDVSLDEYEKIYCSIITLEELDKLKTSENALKRYRARSGIRKLNEIKDKIQYVFASYQDLNNGINNNIYLDLDKPDNIIIFHAMRIQKETDPECIMLTQDVNMIEKCKALGVLVKDIGEYRLKQIYKGYRVVDMDSDEELAYFYEHMTENIYNLKINEYIVIQDGSNNIVGAMKWDGSSHVNLSYRKLTTSFMDTFSPKDVIQECAFDSLFANSITCLFGRSGTGKTSLALNFALDFLKRGKVGKIYVITTNKGLKGAEEIGFLPGDLTQKMLDDNIGRILSTKFGGMDPVQSLISSEQLEILPLSKIRGVEFCDSSVVIVTEAQNISIYQMKTIVQRCKLGCKLICEGDILDQKDVFDNESNGMERMIEVFSNNPDFGVIKLKKNYRSSLGELADLM